MSSPDAPDPGQPLELGIWIGGQLFCAVIQGESAGEAVETLLPKPTPAVWTYMPLSSVWEDGGVLSLGGSYLTTKLTSLPNRNDCLLASSNRADAAVVLPVLLDEHHFCVGLHDDPGTVLTCDTRGYVTQFEALQAADGYPYWQRFVTPEEPRAAAWRG